MTSPYAENVADRTRSAVEHQAPNLFQYDDYHIYLRDWVASRRKQDPSYNYQVLANKAGLKSRSFLRKVSLGAKHLSSTTARAVSGAMGLRKKEADFFLALVAFNNATDLQEKSLHLQSLEKISRLSRQTILSVQQYDLFHKWFIVPMWELVTVVPFAGDFQKLSRQLQPPVTAAEARYAVELLVDMGLIEPSGGLYVQKQSHLETREELRSQAVRAYQIDTMRLAREPLERIPAEDRHIGTLALGFDEAAWRQAKSCIESFRQELANIAAKTPRSDRVYQMNLQMFPLTRIPVKSAN